MQLLITWKAPCGNSQCTLQQACTRELDHTIERQRRWSYVRQAKQRYLDAKSILDEIDIMRAEVLARVQRAKMIHDHMDRDFADKYHHKVLPTYDPSKRHKPVRQPKPVGEADLDRLAKMLKGLSPEKIKELLQKHI